ncbi:MAG: hypothetical protein RMX65_000560 [Nostoc sp. DedQUE01]
MSAIACMEDERSPCRNPQKQSIDTKRGTGDAPPAGLSLDIACCERVSDRFTENLKNNAIAL